MDKILKKIDSYMLFLLLELFIIISIFLMNQDQSLKIIDFIMFCMTFFVTMVTYVGGMVIGLILSSAIIFIYASYIFYSQLISKVQIEYISYVWMVSIPVLSLTMGKLSAHIITLQESNISLRDSYNNLVTIDENTGLGNVKLFYMTLDREMSKARRHKLPCTLMIVKFSYYKELIKILGDAQTTKVLKNISDVLISCTRIEDEICTIEDGTLAIIMPTTPVDGATIVKNRIKEGIIDLNLRLKEEKIYANIDIKIAILEYKDSIKTAMEFKMLAEEELQYDV